MVAAISVCVEGISFQYRFTEDDLRKVFGRYGDIDSVEVQQDGSNAKIWFTNNHDADTSIRELHGKYLNGEEGQLVVTWATQSLSNICPPRNVDGAEVGEQNAQTQQPQQLDPTNDNNGLVIPGIVSQNVNSPVQLQTLQAACLQPATVTTIDNLGSGVVPHQYVTANGGVVSAVPGQPAHQLIPAGGPGIHLLAPAIGDAATTASATAARNAKLAALDQIGSSGRKYTCRIDVGLQNEESFQVAKKLIGIKGANMKLIVQETGAKLRLRGRDSGYLEGTAQEESNEPLHLCVSCMDFHGYQVAKKMAMDVIQSTLQEYKTFRMNNGLECPKLHVKVTEHPVILTFGDKHNKGGKFGGKSRGKNSGGKKNNNSTAIHPGSGNGNHQGGAAHAHHGNGNANANGTNHKLYPGSGGEHKYPGSNSHQNSGFGMESGIPENHMLYGGVHGVPMHYDIPQDGQGYPGQPTENWRMGARASRWDDRTVTPNTTSRSDNTPSTALRNGTNEPPTPSEIERLVERRNESRRVGNYEEADRIRQQLHARGVALMDEPGGRGRGNDVTTWRYFGAMGDEKCSKTPMGAGGAGGGGSGMKMGISPGKDLTGGYPMNSNYSRPAGRF